MQQRRPTQTVATHQARQPAGNAIDSDGALSIAAGNPTREVEEGIRATRSKTPAMRTLADWWVCACWALTGVSTMLTGCDAPSALSGYLGGHGREPIRAESVASAAAPLPLASSVPALDSAAPVAPSPASQTDGVGAQRRVGDPYQKPASPSPNRSLHPTSGLLPTAPDPMAPLLPPAMGAGGVVKGAARTRNVAIGGAAVSGANVSNAARVVAGLRDRFRECYGRELSASSGAMRFALKVGPTGAVTEATATKSADLSARLLSCATNATKNARFEVPEGGEATIQFPVSFVSEAGGSSRITAPGPGLPHRPKGSTTL